ncbi:ribosomal protection-like ABC-F family protein [uncultured Robinsoniella sp.]|uniref:ribosomal protection-like ABC-F family protein n=1 Tax=uncultured Robinsoniella sp. TaxID=904190 RepID=UPI00374F5B19
MLLKVQNLKKGYGIQELFSIDRLTIEEGDRIGLVGLNGAGKSTLLHILYGSEQADEGEINRYCEIAMIEQCQEEADDRQMQDVSPQLLSRMQIKDSACKSGGEKTRQAIAAALSQGSRLLFADEPTTNLDVKGIETLEKMLMGYRGAFVLISHDRYLLDKVCTSIWEIEEGKLREFPGRYSQWKEQKEREREFAMFEFEQYQQERKRITIAMNQVKNEASQMLKPPKQMGHSEWMLYKGVAREQQKNVQSRGKAMEKRLEKLEVKEKPKELAPVVMRLGMDNPLSGKTAVRIQGLTVQYGKKMVLNEVNLTLKANKCTVMMGANGTGKSTLIKKIMEHHPSVYVNPDVKIGYFSQEHETLDVNRTVLENVRADSNLKEHVIRCILANLYLTEQHIHKPVSVLSGGERAKVMLARLMASDVNVLILDEPTNHIDMYTAEALEGLLDKWEGTMLIVTHDRSLAKNTADRLVFLENGKLEEFEGNWEAYEQEKERASKPKEVLKLDKTLLSMKMAELSMRLRKPKKGDNVLKLKEELDQVTEAYYQVNQ